MLCPMSTGGDFAGARLVDEDEQRVAEMRREDRLPYISSRYFTTLGAGNIQGVA